MDDIALVFISLILLLLYVFCLCSHFCNRLILNSIVAIKMEQFEMSKIRMQTAEEYLKSFFEAELKSLWPAGWMQARCVNDESISTVHGCL